MAGCRGGEIRDNLTVPSNTRIIAYVHNIRPANDDDVSPARLRMTCALANRLVGCAFPGH